MAGVTVRIVNRPCNNSFHGGAKAVYLWIFAGFVRSRLPMPAIGQPHNARALIVISRCETSPSTCVEVYASCWFSIWRSNWVQLGPQRGFGSSLCMEAYSHR